MQFGGVGFDESEGVVEVEMHGEVFLLGERAGEVEQGFDDFSQGAGLPVDFESAGLDFGEVEEVVDDVEEAFAGAEDIVGIASGFVVVLGGGLIA